MLLSLAVAVIPGYHNSHSSLRSHLCGELRSSHVGENVILCGWLHKMRYEYTLWQSLYILCRMSHSFNKKALCDKFSIEVFMLASIHCNDVGCAFALTTVEICSPKLRDSLKQTILLKGLCAVYEAVHLHIYLRNNVMRNLNGNSYTLRYIKSEWRHAVISRWHQSACSLMSLLIQIAKR